MVEEILTGGICNFHAPPVSYLGWSQRVYPYDVHKSIENHGERRRDHVTVERKPLMSSLAVKPGKQDRPGITGSAVRIAIRAH
jgi:hypothetical protein